VLIESWTFYNRLALFDIVIVCDGEYMRGSGHKIWYGIILLKVAGSFQVTSQQGLGGRVRVLAGESLTEF